MNNLLEKNKDYSAVLPQPPIFVVGYMHSGTTLLVNIIKGHSSVFSGNRETKFFMYLPMIRKRFPDLEDDEVLKEFVNFIIVNVKTGYSSDKLRENPGFYSGWLGNDKNRYQAILSDAKQCKDYQAIFAIVSNHLTKAVGKLRWVEKTPTHIFHLDEIIQCVPDALFVEIIRDPRDILASKKTRWSQVQISDKYKEKRIAKSFEKAFDPVWDSLSWQSAVRAGQIAKTKYPDRIYSIKYENLVEDPETEVRRLCSFLNMDFEAGILNIQIRNSAADDLRETFKGGIVKTSVGRWKNNLSDTDVMICQWVLKKELNFLGYDVSATSLKTKLKFPVVVLRAIFEFFLRLYRRLRMGGWGYLRNVITNYRKRVKISFSRL